MSSLIIKDVLWLAAIFEGEGTTGLFKTRRKNNDKWRISTYFLICNNDPIIINEAWEIAAKLNVGMCIYQREGSTPNANLNYQICCKNMKGVYKMLETLLPYIRGNKRAVAEMTMRFITSRDFGDLTKRKPYYSDEEWKLYEKVKETNQQGKKKKFESSETLRNALTNIEKILSGEDKVQTSMKIGEEIPIS